MHAALILMLMLGQKFYTDDPVQQDDDSKVEVTQITKHKLNDQFDFFQHSFGKPGDRSKSPAANVNTPASFGKITGTIGNPREMQLGLKFYF